MNTSDTATDGRLVQVVSLECKDAGSAQEIMDVLANFARPNAMAYGCVSYEFGLKVGAPDTVCVVARWNRWEDFEKLLEEKVGPELPKHSHLLKRPLDLAQDAVRIRLEVE